MAGPSTRWGGDFLRIMSRAQQNIEKRKAIGAIRAHLNVLREHRPSLILSNGKSARTRAKIEQIIRSARAVFTQAGHAGLSLRKVAAHAGVAVGNLNYYFPTKRALLDAMLRETLANYVEEHLAQFEADSDSPLDILLNVIAFYARNAKASHQFFYQMWGYAGCDEKAMETVRSLYQPIGRFVYYLVRAANPELNDAEIRRATLQIFALEEGYKLFMGLGPRDADVFATAEEDIRILTRQIVFAE